MRLATRLLLLTLASLLPTLILGALAELDQRTERKAQLGTLVLRQAELLNGDISSIALGTRSLLTTAAEFRFVQMLQPACADQLAAVQRRLPSYAFFAVLDGKGGLVCGSKPGLVADSSPAPSWLAAAMAAEHFVTGHFTEAPGVDAPFLPFFLPLSGARGERRGTIVAGLDLRWLASHLDDLETTDSRLLRGSMITVTDRDGVTLATDPGHASFVGKRVPEAVLALVDSPQSGIARLDTIDGKRRLVGYVPVARSDSGLLVTAGFFEPALMAEFNRATMRDVLLLIGAALTALVLALLAARRFIGKPTAELVSVARRWRQGDLHARADVPEVRSEFGQIAAACNEMADALEHREAELRQQAQTLEARVAARTLALSKTNDRLQVEIAEHKQTEATLLQAQKLQTVGQLAGGIAHDFNNLLATILGSLELIGHDLTADQARLRSMVERASDAVQRGAHLTSRLLAYSRRKPLAMRAADINQLIGDLSTLLATTTLGQLIRLELRLEPTLWPAMAEPSQVEAAVLNLALNARDAMPRGGVLMISTGNETLTARRGPDDPAPGDYVRVTLRDTGEGMSEEVARRAFEPFFTTKGAAGSGLGLSQVLALSREAGGTVRIETEPGEGTAITLLLPRATAAAGGRRQYPDRRRARPWNVLLVEDDPAVRQVTRDMLVELGCRVSQAEHGAEALGILRQRDDRTELLMVDYAMPGMNGLAVAAAARARGFAGPVLLATGYAEAAEPELGEAAPDSVLRKPFSGQDLARALSGLVSTRATAETLQRAK